MIRAKEGIENGRYELAASLADAAYQVILSQGIQGSFIELRLSLWKRFLVELRDRESARLAQRPILDWSAVERSGAVW